MLLAHPTKNGTGVSIYGDLGDLHSLYDTVHEIAGVLDENNKKQTGQFQLLMNFAYEIRKACSGDRLKDSVQFPNSKQTIDYFGFNIVWTDIILFVIALRKNIGSDQASKLNQANIYMLEYIVETALSEYDKDGAVKIKQYLTKGINIQNECVFLLYQSMHIEYVSDKSKNVRFKNIPKLIQRHFAEGSQSYNEIMGSFYSIASEEKCEVTDLEFQDFIEIEW